MVSEKGRIFGLVYFQSRVSDQGKGPDGQKQIGTGAGDRYLVTFK